MTDVPETHSGPEEMARCLVTYIADVDRVFRLVRAEFQSSPSHRTIKEMRERHLQPPMKTEDYKPADRWSPLKESDNAREASERFLQRLEAERALSLARAESSTFLTHKGLIDAHWDKAMRG